MFVLLGLLILGVIAGAPFYASLVQSPEQRTEAAIARDVAAIDRSVFNVDPQLAAVKDMGGDQKSEISDEVARRKDIYDKSLLASLQQTTTALRNAVEADQKRAMKSKAATKFTSGPTAVTSVESETKKLISLQEQAVKEGESAIKRLPSTSHLWSNRAKAVYQASAGQLQRLRGDLEASQARELCEAAESQAAPLAEMRRTAATIEGQKPAAAVEAIGKLIEQAGADLAAAQEDAQKLSGQIAALESKAAGLEASAAEKRSRMTELASSSSLSGASGREYNQLSNEARRAEAEATAIRTGTLTGGKASDTSFESAMPKYEGGTPTPGIRDLKFDLDRQQEKITLIEAHKAELTKRQEAVSEAVKQFDDQKAEVTKSIDALAESIGLVVAEAEKHEAAARKSYDDAGKTFATGMKSARAAVSDAKKRTSDAKAGHDDRSTRVAGDTDMEASMNCLVAEIAFQNALMDSTKIELTESLAAARGAMGGEKAAPSADDIDKLRTDAANQLAEASKAYEQAANLIGKSSAKFADTTISGKNYVWQAQLGQAAIQLMKSALADKPEDRAAAQEAAYKDLKEIAKGREQSPLIASALETLVYLQQSAK
ncbi:MAG TPA: hypothetical protein VMV81_14430 [Phycisphaerae bacterium]|nr:hypothetical protein [Phycisphaerae bacterium]